MTASASEVLTATASVVGSASAATSYEAEVNAEPPPFGFLDGPTGFSTLATEADGSAATTSGGRPDQMTFNLAFPTEQGLGGAHWRGPRACSCYRPAPRPCRQPQCHLGSLHRGTVARNQRRQLRLPGRFAGGHGDGDVRNRRPVGCGESPLQHGAPARLAAELGFEALNVGIYIHLDGGCARRATTASRR